MSSRPSFTSSQKGTLVVFVLLLIIYSLFSYSLTHPSLVLTSWPPYWTFQLWLRDTLYNQRWLLGLTYGVLMTALFAVYGLFLYLAKKHPVQLSVKKSLVLYALCIAPLILSYNALSHDVFNYIFNAKMVLVYQTNPHFDNAQNYSFDLWTRFMTNTHTSAPYGYGWTALTLLPYVVGFGKFVPTWLIFRALSVLSVFALFFVLRSFSAQWSNKKKPAFSTWEFFLLFLNPLFLIEIVSNSHNDVWMMWPAVLSLALLLKPKLTWKVIALSAFLLWASTSIKFATALLTPVWLAVALRQKFITSKQSLLQLFDEYWPFLASLIMFVPLLTFRARQFHPWYLTWVLVWLPFVKFSPWKFAIIFLSYSAMMRYIPWLLTDVTLTYIENQQKMVTFIPFVIVGIVLLAHWGIGQLRKAK